MTLLIRSPERRLALALVFVFLVASNAVWLALLRRPEHDSMLGLLPARIWLSDVLHAHDWPAWYPYSRYGHPLTTVHLMADPWGPLGLALAWLFHYNVWTLAVENVIWRAVGLAGAYCFARRWLSSPLTAIAAAVGYVGSGAVALSVANGATFAGLHVMPWLLVGIDGAVFATSRRAWARATGTLAMAGALLVSSGNPGTWLTAPILLAPYALCQAWSGRRAMARLLGASAVAVALAAGMLAMFLAETVGFRELFGSDLRNAVSAFEGVLPWASVFSIWLVNPTYVPGLSVEWLQSLYVGLVPALLLCARCALFAPPAPAWSRPLALTTAGIMAVVPATMWAQGLAVDQPSTAALFGVIRPDQMLVAALLTFAAAVPPRRIGHWARVDVALSALCITSLLVATRNPLGDVLRLHVVPFSLVRWNYLYAWTIVLAAPVLAWRLAEEVARGLASPEAIGSVATVSGRGEVSRVRFQQVAVATAGLLAALVMVVSATPLKAYVPPMDPPPERMGTVLAAWTVAFLTVAAAGAAGYSWRRRSYPYASAVTWLVAGAGTLLLGTLASGYRYFGWESLARGYVFLPIGDRLTLDLLHQALVLALLAAAGWRGRTGAAVLRAAVLVTIFDLSLASNRYLSDGGIVVANQGPPAVTLSRPFEFRGAERVPDEVSGMAPALTKMPNMWAWPGFVTHVAALDRSLGEPSIFRSFAQFPSWWTPGETVGDVQVTAAAFRAESTEFTGVSSTVPGARTPKCPGGQPDPSAATAEVTQMLSSVVDLEVQTACERLLVFTDTWSPAWQVRVDGRPAAALRVDVAIRGVMVPAGRHLVEWRYRPRHLMPLLALMSVSTLIALVMAAPPAPIIDLVRRRALSVATA